MKGSTGSSRGTPAAVNTDETEPTEVDEEAAEIDPRDDAAAEEIKEMVEEANDGDDDPT